MSTTGKTVAGHTNTRDQRQRRQAYRSKWTHKTNSVPLQGVLPLFLSCVFGHAEIRLAPVAIKSVQLRTNRE